MSILVTGGCGFIGSNFIRKVLHYTDQSIINVDRMTYAGVNVIDDPRYTFYQMDIGDHKVSDILSLHKPSHIINFAAETHVDRSINDPFSFVKTNILSTYNFICSVQKYWEENNHPSLRFLHMSTDEVFGQLKMGEPAFTEDSPYSPNSPYAATKASADHLIRAFQHTYKFPGMIVHCTNNYGPYQYPEKFIPVAIIRALMDKPIQIYGSGMNVRDWIFVDDACDALYAILMEGVLGERYNIGASNERTNLNVATSVLRLLDKPMSLIKYVEDRKGHDFRYALNTNRFTSKFGWHPDHTFEDGLVKTINWYIENMDWVEKCVNLESF